MKNKYEIRGDVTVIFVNCQGIIRETIIDTSDLKMVSEFPNSWHGNFNKSTKSFYVWGNITEDGIRKNYSLHRIIMKPPENMVVDHINHDTLDNRRENLRVVSNAENQQNIIRARKTSNSGILGVYLKKNLNKWAAQFRKKHLGYFDTIEEATKVVESARAMYMPFSQEAITVLEPCDIEIPSKKNAKKHSGRKGVIWNENIEKWVVNINVNGQRRYYGSFENLDDAIKVANEAERGKKFRLAPRKTNKSSGERNISFHKRSGKWAVSIKGKHYGYFLDIDAAKRERERILSQLESEKAELEAQLKEMGEAP